MNRLDSISKELSKQILQSSFDIQKKLLKNVCNYALKKANLDKPILNDLLSRINENNEFSIDENQKLELESMLEQYDNEYFDIQEAEEESGSDEKKYLIPFGKARALSALLFAVSIQDTPTATIETVYEGLMVDSNNIELRDIINDTLKKG